MSYQPHERPEHEWAIFTEMAAPDDDVNTALVAILGTTTRDRQTGEVDPESYNRQPGTTGTTDYRIILRSFGGDLARDANVRCARALRTLEKQRRIVWEATGRIRLLDRGVDADIIPIRPEPPEIHGPFGNRRDQDPPTGVMLPTDTTEMGQEVRNVPAPVLNTPEPEKPAQSFQDAVDAVSDAMRDDTEPF